MGKFGQKTVSILGSTGSIGKSTVELLLEHPDRFKVHALTARKNFDLLAEQAIKLNASHVVILEEECYDSLKQKLDGTDINIAAGKQALLEVSRIPTDITIAAIVGAAGLESLFEAVRYSKTIGLANKESLVCAGNIFMSQIEQYKTNLLPVDSEHNAIFQVLENDQKDVLEKIILTASGGSFREYSLQDMKNITPEQAVCHPNWDMGAKISVDSSTMFNKGLEVIEAYYLFNLPIEQIEVLVHPESIIHSMVCYQDGSTLAQMGVSDMKIPISYVLGWPKRINNKVPTLDLLSNNRLTFFAPDYKKFPLLLMAKQVLNEGNGSAIALNAANEVAVDAFLKSQIGFLDIMKVVSDVLELGRFHAPSSLEDVIAIDQENRSRSDYIIRNRKVA